MNSNRQKAFTLLELIIVIIIVGVLSSLALPRFFKMIEFSRSSEAVLALQSIHQAVERCYLMHNGSYTTCDFGSGLDLENPEQSPNAHFTYLVTTGLSEVTWDYQIKASRNTRAGGNVTDYIILTASNTQGKFNLRGFGTFANIRFGEDILMDGGPPPEP